MTDKQKINLIDTTIFMLNDRKFKFDMRFFQVMKETKKYPHTIVDPQRCGWDDVANSVVFNECGTSCCLAGYGALAIRKKTKNVSWCEFINTHFGVDQNDYVYDFLFSAAIEQDRRDAAARVLWFLNGESIIGWDEDDKFYEVFTSQCIENALQEIKGEIG